MAQDDVSRVKSVIDWLIFNRIAKSQKGVAELMGYNHCVLSQALNNKSPITKRFIMALCSIDERINPEWVKTGEGEMIAPVNQNQKDEVSHGLAILKSAKESKIDTAELMRTTMEIIGKHMAEIAILRSENDKLRAENERFRKELGLPSGIPEFPEL